MEKKAYFRFGKAMSCQLDHGEVSFAEGSFYIVKSHPNGLLHTTSVRIGHDHGSRQERARSKAGLELTTTPKLGDGGSTDTGSSLLGQHLLTVVRLLLGIAMCEMRDDGRRMNKEDERLNILL